MPPPCSSAPYRRLALVYLSLLVSIVTACNRPATARSSREHSGPPLDEDQVKIGVLKTEMSAWMNQPYQNSSNMPPNLQEVVFALNGSVAEPSDPDRIFSGTNPHCSSCRLLAKFVIGYVRGGGPVEPMAKFIIAICYLAFYRSKKVCGGIINQEKETMAFIILNSSVSGDQLCAMVMSGSSLPGGCGMYRGPRWTVALPGPSISYSTSYSSKVGQIAAPKVLQAAPSQISGSTLNYPIAPPVKFHDDKDNGKQSFSTFFTTVPNKLWYRNGLFNRGLPYLKVLHLTDIHFDPNYKEGSSAVCDAPLCCSKESGVARYPGEAAGKWGDYRDCDSPRILVENMLAHISEHHPDIDYIMWTGDSVPHDLWKITRRGNTAVVSQVADMIRKYFPGVPVFGSIGNHESFPRDSFPPPEVPLVWKRFGVQWLYDTVVNQWQSFVPGMPISGSARVAGCYSLPVRRDFKIISINTNYCYKFNWWTLFKSVDPGHVLRWLVGELLTAEANGEYVHIIGHIAPLYPDCYEEWGHQFSRIVTRFSHIIKGQFYGHCHRDEVRVHFDVRNPKLPIGLEYLTPNNGPYKGLNPSFRLFYIDGDHRDTKRSVIDYETYFMNLTRANLYGDPRWQLLYRAKRDLGLESLEPRDWDNLAHRMAREPGLAYTYHRYHVQASDVELAKGCDGECRHKLICNIVEGDKFMPKKCRPPR